MAEVTVSVQAEPRDRRHWLALARRLEADGYHALLIGDHPADGPSPWAGARGGGRGDQHPAAGDVRAAGRRPRARTHRRRRGGTLPDGHHHEVRWSEQHLRTQLELVRAGAERAGSSPAVEILVQRVVRTDDLTRYVVREPALDPVEPARTLLRRDR